MKIAVLTSGGVDSSVVLALLKEQGHDVTAFYLKIWLEDELSFLGSCPWEQDLSYVQTLCEQLQVPLEVVPLQEAYREHIVSYVLDQVRAGKTPSPDILCNTFIKFGAFLSVIGPEYDKVASGHYACVRRTESGLYELLQGADRVKDQTYFLSRLSQAQLSRILFPIGHLTKEEVRSQARRLAVPAADRKDSQGICFLGKISFTDFIKQHVGTAPGAIVEEETGCVLGEHEGLWFYTIGQRKGMKLSGGPWFVVRKEVASRTLFVSRTYYDADKKRDRCFMSNIHWIAGCAPGDSACIVKIRHGAHMIEALIKLEGDGAWVQLSERDQGLAPGQFVVLYHNNVCLGSGVIEMM